MDSSSGKKVTDVDLIKAVNALSDAYNSMSMAFIRFSLAYGQVSQVMLELKADNPTLFDEEIHLNDQENNHV